MKTVRASFFDFLKAGNISFAPFAVIGGREVFPASVKKTAWDDGVRLRFEYAGGMTDDFYYRNSVCVRKFRVGGKAIGLNELGLTLTGIALGGRAADDYFYHNENPRLYACMTFPVDYDRTHADAPGNAAFGIAVDCRWADTGDVCERVGRSPYQTFPAIHLGNHARKHGIVHGTLAQDPFYHNYLIRHEKGRIRLDIFSSFKAVDRLELPAGKVLTDEWYLGATEHADDLDRLFEGYTAVLRTKLPVNYGATKINRDNLVWGSWNDGICRNVSEKLVLKEAAYLKKHFPTVRWIQLDDGYAVRTPPAHGLGVPYEGEKGVDRRKFPKGLRHLADEIRRIGLRPALWVGGLCEHTVPICRDHPEWFCDYSARIKNQSPLDPSVPEARGYMTHALDVLVSEYGFDAMKHDFWSYAFEDPRPLYRHRTRSGYEYRDWWLREIRKRLASDGYLQSGCDIGMGNPFLGQYFTNYRYGIDIGSGVWEHVKTNFLWGVACFSLHTSDLFVPNSDAIGLFPGLNDTDAMFALNYCVVTRSMVEIAGKLSENARHPRLPLLKKAACCVNNGQDVWLLDYDYRKTGAGVPKGLYIKSAFFSPEEGDPHMPVRTVGLFNTDDRARTVRFDAAKLGLDARKTWIVVDVWTHEEWRMSPGKTLAFRLPPHGSRMLAAAADDLVLLDADVRVDTVTRDGNTLSVDCAFAVPEADFLFSRDVAGVTFAGRPVKAEIRGRVCRLALKRAGVYRFRF